MAEHDHEWTHDYKLSGHLLLAYRCACGAWGKRSLGMGRRSKPAIVETTEKKLRAQLEIDEWFNKHMARKACGHG